MCWNESKLMEEGLIIKLYVSFRKTTLRLEEGLNSKIKYYKLNSNKKNHWNVSWRFLKNSNQNWVHLSVVFMEKRRLKKLKSKYPLNQVILWRHSCSERVFPDSVIQNIIKFFVRNSHDFVKWTWAIQSEYETLINHSASKPKIQSEWKTTLRLFNNYVDRILPIFKLK